MDLQKQPRTKQSVTMICIAVLCAALVAVLAVVGSIYLAVSGQNKKNMHLSFWDSSFTVETAFCDPAGGVTLVVSEVSKGSEYESDNAIELRGALPKRNMPLTVTDDVTTYVSEDIYYTADCALSEGKLVTYYVLYIPQTQGDLTLDINGKSVPVRLTYAQDITPYTDTMESAVGDLTMESYYLGGNICAVWCKADTDTDIKSIGLTGLDVKYTSDIVYRDLLVQMPQNGNASLQLLCLMGTKPGYKKDARVATSFQYDGFYYELEADINAKLPVVTQESALNQTVDAENGITVGKVVRRTKQVLCYLNTATKTDSLVSAKGYIGAVNVALTDAQKRTNASLSGDYVVVNGASSNEGDSLQLQVTSLTYAVTKPTASAPFTKTK